MITPGIGTDDHLLKQKENNFLGAIHVGSTGEVGCSFLDLSTGEFMLYQGDKLSVQKLLSTYNPKEVIFGNSQKSHIDNLLGDSYYSYSLDDWIFQYDYAYGKLIDLFEVKNLKGFAVNGCKYGQISAGAILHYLELTEQRQLGHINKIARINLDQFVWLDQFTIRNLELIHATHPSGIPLVDVIDQTTTPMGGRLLRKWLLLPLTDKNLIEERLNAVELLFTKQGLSEDLDDHLKVISDLERIVAKVALHKVNPRELYNLKISLERIPLIVSLFKDHTENGLDPILKSMSHLPDIVQKLDLSLNPHPPINTSKGGVIKDGYNAELDKLRDLIANSKSHLEKLLQSEIIKTKITNLKVGFNNVFGYYFEVTNRYKDQNLIPEDWTRKQTLTNCERYISEELKTLEGEILSAEERILSLEEKLYDEIVHWLQSHIQSMQKNANLLSRLDCLNSFAKIARRNAYVKPSINEETNLHIKDGRHPVIEQHLPLGENYIPNDLNIQSGEDQILLITGPNMSGKSAILRQTALICILAQIGNKILILVSVCDFEVITEDIIKSHLEVGYFCLDYF